MATAEQINKQQSAGYNAQRHAYDHLAAQQSNQIFAGQANANGLAPIPPPPQPGGEIAEVVEVLREQLDNLHKATYSLLERLSPVLRNADNADCGRPSKPYQTPLGGTLGEFSVSLAQAIDRVTTMRVLIEL